MAHLLVFGYPDSSGDGYCFDYARVRQDGEAPVVRLSHENAEAEDRADSFIEFVQSAEAGRFEHD